MPYTRRCSTPSRVSSARRTRRCPRCRASRRTSPLAPAAVRSRRAAPMCRTCAASRRRRSTRSEPGHRWACWHPCADEVRPVSAGRAAARGAQPRAGVRGPGAAAASRAASFRPSPTCRSDRERRDARPRRRDRLGEVDAGARAPAGPWAQGGEVLFEGSISSACRVGSCCEARRRCRWSSRTPSARWTRSGGGANRRGAADRVTAGHARRARRGSARCSSASAWTPTSTADGARARCRAARRNAWRSPGRWRSTRR